MNLGNMLAAGKCFISGRAAAAYRKNKNVYLPKFNSEKNPFLPKQVESNPAAPAPKMTPPTAAATQKIAPPPAAKTVREKSWADKFNPFRLPEPVRTPTAGAVQVELSLDAVKVIHNDLADADIEVVPVKSRTVAPVEVPLLPPARHAWEFLGERLTAR
jgi:hypothetical protein